MVNAFNEERINQIVWRQYPEFQGVRPMVQHANINSSSASASQSASIRSENKHTILLYQAYVRLPNGKSMSRWVRVSLKQDGSIAKISSSK